MVRKKKRRIFRRGVTGGFGSMSLQDYFLSRTPEYGTDLGGGQWGFSQSEYTYLAGQYNAGGGNFSYGVF